MKKTNVMTALLVLVFAIAAFSVSAADEAKGAKVASITVGPDGTATVTAGGSNDDTANGGNVTEVNLTQTASSMKWQGYYGEVNSQLIIGVGSDVFFDFTANSGADNETAVSDVFASANTDFDFTALDVVDDAQQIDGAYNFDNADSDSADVTLAGTDKRYVIGGMAATVGTNFTSNNFHMGAFDDGTVTLATDNGTELNYSYGAKCNHNAADFLGATSDYEFMVPVNMSNGGAGPFAGEMTYYFFMVLN